MNKVNSSEVGLLLLLLAVQGVLTAVRSALIHSRWEHDEEAPIPGLPVRPDITHLSVSLDLIFIIVTGLYFAVGLHALQPPLQELLDTLIPGAIAWTPWIAYGVLLIILSWLSLIVGTLTPEAIGQTFANTWAGASTAASRVLHYILQPFSMSALALSNLLAQGFKGDPLQRFAIITEDEIKSLVTAGEQEGIIEEEAREMIYSIFRLGNTITREIMVPRIDVIALEINSPLSEALEAIIASGHSRIPVYDETIDNIVGILHAKDILLQYREQGESTPIHKEHLRSAYFVPESKRVDSLLKEMQTEKLQLAIVVDEYGGTAGIITLEDIVEEIVGEIQDEYDREEPEAILQDDGSYLFEARIPLDDVEMILDIPLPLEEADSLSGFIYNQLGHVPTLGESVTFEDVNFEVLEITGRRIRKVLATRTNPDTA